MSAQKTRLRSFRPLCALAAAVATLWPALVQAQVGEIKPARIEYEYFPSASVSGPDAAGTGDKVSFEAARASLTLPTPLSKSTILLPALRYQVLDFSGHASTPRDRAPVEALHSLTLGLGVFQQLSSSWSLFAQVGGGLAGDLAQEVTSDDWVVSAQLIGMWTLHPSFTLGAGLGYDRRTGQVAPLPLVAVNWEPSSDLLLRGILPQFLALRYRAADPITLAVEAGLDGERYHLSEQSVDVAHAEVAYSVVKLGPSVTLHWTKWLHTRVNAGMAMHRRFELYERDQSRGDLDLDAGPFAGVELWLGPSGWSSDAAETALAAAGRGSADGPPPADAATD